VLLTLWFAGYSPISVIIGNLIYDPVSGYYRYWTWQMVGVAVHDSPWFGLGIGPYPEDYEINHTIDSLWLILALRFGIPCAIFVALSMFGTGLWPSATRRAEEKLSIALEIVTLMIVIIGFTTDFWGQTWVLTGLIVGTKAHLNELKTNIATGRGLT
jgi:hypothetical protein